MNGTRPVATALDWLRVNLAIGTLSVCIRSARSSALSAQLDAPERS